MYLVKTLILPGLGRRLHPLVLPQFQNPRPLSRRHEDLLRRPAPPSHHQLRVDPFENVATDTQRATGAVDEIIHPLLCSWLGPARKTDTLPHTQIVLWSRARALRTLPCLELLSVSCTALNKSSLVTTVLSASIALPRDITSSCEITLFGSSKSSSSMFPRSCLQFTNKRARRITHIDTSFGFAPHGTLN